MFDPDNRIGDPQRLAALRATGLMNSATEESFDRLTRLAVRTTGASMAAVVLIDDECQLFKSAIGPGDEWTVGRRSPLERSVCRHVLASGRPLVVADLRDHPEVGVNRPLAYLGVPLATGDGQLLGAFCVLDQAPRTWSDTDLATLTDLAACAGTEINLRLDIARRVELERELSEAKSLFDAYMENSPAFAFAKDRDGRITYLNSRFHREIDRHDWIGKSDFELWPAEVAEKLRRNDMEVWATNRPIEFVEEVRSPTGQVCRYLCLKFPYQTPDGVTWLGGVAIDITELWRTEEALRRSEAESRTLAMAVARIDGAVAVADASGQLQYMSEAYARLFGNGSPAGGDLIGHSLAVANDRSALAALRARLTAGERIEFALAQFNDEGDRLWVELEVQTIRNEAGEVDQYVAIARDLTERRQTESMMAATSACDTILAQSAHLAEAAPRLLRELGTALDVESAIFWETDPTGTTINPRLRWNGALEVHAGRPKTWASRAEGGHADPIRAWLMTNLAANRPRQPRPTEELPNCCDGNCQHLIAPANFGWSIPDRNRLVGFSFQNRVPRQPSRRWTDLIIGLCRKVGAFVERKQAEEDRNRLAAIIEASDDFFGLCDPSGLVLYRNAAYHETVGTHADLLPAGFPFERSFTPWAADLLRQVAWPEAIRTGSWLGETAIRAADGRLIPVSHRLIAHRGPDGEVAYLATFLRDITAHKATEAESRAARQAAEAANRAKSEFLANMSHEIRTPMNGILGMTELTLDTELTPLQREYLGLVRASGESLLRLINDILDFSRMEAGRLALEVVEFALHDLIYETIRPLALRAHAAHLDLICQIDAGVPEVVCGDPHRLRQVLVNLVGNAVKFTPRGEILVRVARSTDGPSVLSTTATDEIPLRFSVTDTGVGVPPAKLATIFEPFEQADNSTSRTYGGSGLGLAISTEIAHLMRGRLWAESQPNQGSTFYLDVPLGRVEPQPEPTNHPELAGRRILVAISNATRRRFIVADLLGQKLVPSVLPEGRSVRDELTAAADAGSPFDLALMDDLMPGLNLAHLARSVRLVVLSTTGRSPQAEADGRLVRSVPKPVSPGQLMAALSAALVAPDVCPASLGSSSDPRSRTEPLATAAVALGLSTAQKQSPSPPAPPPRSLRILLAEDQLVNRKVAARMLERLGHSVVTVQDGREVLAHLGETLFDVVLMDIQMPVMDGFEAVTAIRRQANWPIPLIALTAHAMKGDRERCLAAGFDDYLSKPITSRDLETVLGRVAHAQGHANAQANREDAAAPAAT